MSSVSTLTRSRTQRGRYRRRYRRSLLLAAFDGRISSRSRMPTGFRQPERARSTVVNCYPTTFNEHFPICSKLCQPFNTHTAGIVERFSPIRF
jgi:hypothetical protein